MQTTLLNGRVNGKRGRGRPRTPWTSNIKEWTGKGYIDAVRLTSNKHDWRIIALNPLQEEGPPDYYDDVDDYDDDDDDDDVDDEWWIKMMVMMNLIKIETVQSENNRL